MIPEITLKNYIELAVATEENGAKFYQKLAKKFANNEDVSDLFTRLAKDEAIHKAKFLELLNDLPEEGISLAPERAQYVKAMSTSKFFSRKRGPFKDIDKIINRDDALETAFSFEKATLGFYQAVRDFFVGDSKVLIKVIEAEKEHVVKIMGVMMTGAKFRGLENDWS